MINVNENYRSLAGVNISFSATKALDGFVHVGVDYLGSLGNNTKITRCQVAWTWKRVSDGFNYGGPASVNQDPSSLNIFDYVWSQTNSYLPDETVELYVTVGVFSQDIATGAESSAATTIATGIIFVPFSGTMTASINDPVSKPIHFVVGNYSCTSGHTITSYSWTVNKLVNGSWVNVGSGSSSSIALSQNDSDNPIQYQIILNVTGTKDGVTESHTYYEYCSYLGAA